MISILYGLNLTTAYLLMLAVMTYNIIAFVAIIVGLSLCHYVLFSSSSIAAFAKLQEPCCPEP